MKDFWKPLISLTALVIIAIHVALSGGQINIFTLGLFVIAMLPWVWTGIESLRIANLVDVKTRDIKTKVEQQQSEINTLKFLVSHFVTDDELRHLKNLAASEPFPFTISSETWPFFEKELRRLRSFGLINNYPDRGIRWMVQRKQGDVKDSFAITKTGRDYLELRAQVDSKTSAQNDDS